MRLCTVINYWDGGELLPYVVKNMRPLVDGIIIVFSDTSNYGEVVNNTEFLNQPDFDGCEIFRCEPLKTLAPLDNERRKRNFGLQKAKELGYTHFLAQDCDEFYEVEPFLKEKERFKSDLNGLCCACQVYFAKPTLTIGLDVTIVPFIHKITPQLTHTWNPKYPYAFVNGGIRIDPTRQLNITSGVEWSEIIMHHMSYVRKDILSKIRNSTARPNIERQNIGSEIVTAKDGYFVQFYQRHLRTVPNVFGLPDYGVLDQDLQPLATAHKKDQPKGS